MQRLLDKGLEQLTAIIFKMGEVAEKSLNQSIAGYLDGREVSENIGELSEIIVTMTSEVEEKAFALIAKYQPVASDLRIINSYIKIAYDFERYGRYAWDIALVYKRLGGIDDLTKCSDWIPKHISEMCEKVLKSVRISTESLKSLDTELAKTITKTEQKVDELYFKYLDKLITETKVPSKCVISSGYVIRYLERIADHATYIAESVVYIATAQKVNLR
jgi:phosphate transport system protein